MMTMFKLDLACLRGSWKSLAPATLCIAIMMGVSIGVSGAVAMVCVMLSTMLVNMLFAVDVDGGWQELRLAMPLTPAQVVSGRYLAALASIVAGAIVGLALGGALYALRDVVAPYVGSDLGVNAWMLAGALFASICISLVMQAFTMPVLLAFGFAKAARFVPLVAMLLGVSAMGVVGFVAEKAGEGKIAWITSLRGGRVFDGVLSVGSCDLSLVAIALAFAAATLACFAVSYAVSCRLYAKRGF